MHQKQIFLFNVHKEDLSFTFTLKRSQAHSPLDFVLFENSLTFGFSSACEGPVLPGDLVPEGGHPEVPLHLGDKEAGGWCRALVVIANLVKPAGGPSRKMLPRL